jgi:hypothetical protein
MAWQALADELTPARSLARVDAATARVSTNVTVVGTLLTGLGIVAARLPTGGGAGRYLALTAVVSAVLAVACALTAQILTIHRGMNTNNLVAVKAWYRSQFRRRAQAARAATVLLLVAVLLAGVTAAITILDTQRNPPMLAISQSRTASAAGAGSASPAGVTLTVDIAFHDLAAGATATVVITARDSAGTSVLARAAMTRGADGVAIRSLTVSGVPSDAVIDVTASGGNQSCRAGLDLARTAPPDVACRPVDHA